MRINIIVCDDESITLKINCTYIEELAKKYRVDANVIGFPDGDKVLNFMESNQIDIAFLDIDLKNSKVGNGIALAAKLYKKNPRVITIFVTGHREFAYDAFMVEAFSYLTKPVDQERLERIFKKAVVHITNVNSRLQRVPLLITESKVKRKINQSSILYIERVNSQSIIVTKAANYSVYETITSLSERLEENFVQINQSIIVNLEEVAQIQNYIVTMKTGEIFSVGRTYRKAVKTRYLEYPRV